MKQTITLPQTSYSPVAWHVPAVASIAVLGVLIVCSAFFLRFTGYADFPKSNWSADEYAFTWSGMSLLTKGYPESWSWLDTYSYSDFAVQEWNGNPYRLVQPWFDHPPLFSLMIGAASVVGGAQSYFDVQLSVIRIPMLFLGVLNVLLLFLFCLRTFGSRAAILTGLLYAMNPSVVYLSRLVVTENFIVTLLLFVLLLYQRQRSDVPNAWKYLWFAIAVASIAVWVKMTGFSVVLILASLLAYDGRWGKAVATIAFGAFIASLQIAYGALFDVNMFLHVMLSQADRFTEFSINEYIVGFTDLPFNDPFSLLGLILMLPAIRYAGEKKMFLILPAAVYFFVLLLMGAQSHWYAWYLIPVFPFFAMAFGLVVSKTIGEKGAAFFLLELILLGGWIFQMLTQMNFLSAEHAKILFTLTIVAGFIAGLVGSNGMRWAFLQKGAHHFLFSAYLGVCAAVILNFDVFF